MHHHLVQKMERTRVAVILESMEARDVHHFCALTGFGADGVCPYLAIDAVARLREDDLVPNAPGKDAPESLEKLVENYFHAVEHGMLKVFAKMGISTLASYRGAQLFEAVGLGSERGRLPENCGLGRPFLDAPPAIAASRSSYGQPVRLRRPGLQLAN